MNADITYGVSPLEPKHPPLFTLHTQPQNSSSSKWWHTSSSSVLVLAQPSSTEQVARHIHAFVLETPEFWDCTWFSDHDRVQICIRNVWGRRCGAFSANSTKISQLKEGTGDYVFSLARAHGVGSCQGNGRSGVATICFSEWSVFRDEKGDIENSCVPYACKKVHTYSFFFIMLRYVRG